MSELEAFVVQTARGMYRWEHENRWDTVPPLEGYSDGDAIEINPFPHITAGSKILWPVYGEFREYVSNNIARVYIPPERNDPLPTWFVGPAGDYLIHRGYILPQ